ncbi:MAG: ATP-binding protein [Spirochaetota bacterium]
MKRNIQIQLLMYIPDLLLLALAVIAFVGMFNQQMKVLFIVMGLLIVLMIVRTILINTLIRKLYTSRIIDIRTLINAFKKGRYKLRADQPRGDDALADIHRDLVIVGTHFDNIISSQQGEIEKLRELYDSIVLSLNSYFLVLNEREEIVFANEVFCKKFQMSLGYIAGKKIDDIFYFVTGRIKESIQQVKRDGSSVVLEKTHLLSNERISIIADIKISYITVKGENQIVLVMDDITNRCRKDYQISLISQISESIQHDDRLDHVLHTILTGVTSGTGLGFNRAMLFLKDEKRHMLSGRMAVGPDTIEEAIKIWNSVATGRDENNKAAVKDTTEGKGKELLKKVQTSSFDLKEDNLLVRVLNTATSIHIHDASSDNRVDDEIKRFMDVNEFVIVPLVAGNKTIGVIIADNKYNQIPIGVDSVDLLSIFAYQAALSIESYNNLEMVQDEMDKIQYRQEAIVESEKLAAVGRIASHIAHEIRNPLVTMGGYARRIMQQTDSDIPRGAQVHKAANVIINEADRLEKILSNVMDFTRPSPFILKFNNINEVIEDTVNLLRNLFQEQRVEIDLQLGDNIPLIKSDFNQMKQVMLNLLQNSIDATASHGKIYVLTLMRNRRVVVIVRDTGPGFEPDDIEKVFDPFFSTKVTGVGLGLAIVKKIIMDHGGEITVMNWDKGAEVRISLPLPG